MWRRLDNVSMRRGGEAGFSSSLQPPCIAATPPPHFWLCPRHYFREGTWIQRGRSAAHKNWTRRTGFGRGKGVMQHPHYPLPLSPSPLPLQHLMHVLLFCALIPSLLHQCLLVPSVSQLAGTRTHLHHPPPTLTTTCTNLQTPAPTCTTHHPL